MAINSKQKGARFERQLASLFREFGYTDKDGKKVYTTDVIVEEHEFCESKGSNEQVPTIKPDANGFVSIPDVEEEELPFF